jgi:siderophore synthetase component
LDAFKGDDVDTVVRKIQAKTVGNREAFIESGVASDMHEIFGSEEYVKARRRVFRQLIQALIYEKTIQVTESNGVDNIRFSIEGENADGKRIAYVCFGIRRASFGRIRLAGEPVQRITHADSCEADSISQFLREVRTSFTIVPEYLDRFIQELEHTVAKDAMALINQRNESCCLRDRDYDGIESGLSDAHPYHPCYKSRIGFDYCDNAQFGPEFSPAVMPVWLAVNKACCLTPISESLQYEEFLKAELDAPQLEKFRQHIAKRGEASDDYLLLPVHPWQWRRIISTEYQWDLQSRYIIYLGHGRDVYRPQQSIRTLTNETTRDRCYLKLALNILNTSTTRGLARHTIANAPAISDWLKSIARDDEYLALQLRPVFLGEVAAVSYSSPVSQASPGSLACIWRESLHTHLDAGESALPFSALTAMDRDNRPLIEPWIACLGARPWLQKLIDASVTPLIHMLYAHGLALESHAQNMILLHRQGVPTRVALKDFHDGVRFMPDEVSLPQHISALQATPEQHLKNNSSSYIQASSPDDVRDFLYSAFFSMNLSELALFMTEHFSLPEETFWVMTRDCIQDYQQGFPMLRKRFSMFDLFAETVVVEAHTKRRLQPEKIQRLNRIKNPLRQPARLEQDEL